MQLPKNWTMECDVVFRDELGVKSLVGKATSVAEIEALIVQAVQMEAEREKRWRQLRSKSFTAPPG